MICEKDDDMTYSCKHYDHDTSKIFYAAFELK